ncbi:DUF3558 domain-containing protein [Nocardiopsis algeriensis]|uniref:DUF3558 domain-containing protein n=1 Tax=Nocardiopsis algeriensis TaxID=1478215 RepID=UPI003B434C71
MSENGPYNQPPHNPYGGGDGTGGQPPYGPPPGGGPYGGDPGTGGQPGYGAPMGPGAPGGPYPGHEQQMYAGGQPGYGQPGAYPPPQQPKNGSKAGLWFVIAGSVVIVVLVIAVIFMLATNGNRGGDVAVGDPTPSTPAEETTEPGGDETEAPAGGGTTPSGEPPYAVPTEPCDAFTEQVRADFHIEDEPSKSVQNETSYCELIMTGAPEGNPDGAYGSFSIEYSVPYSAADSVDAASSDYHDELSYVRGEGSYTLYFADGLKDDKEVDLGDEAQYITTEYDFVGSRIPVSVLLIRTANLNILIEYQLHEGYEGGEAEDLKLPDNTEEIMLGAGETALSIVGQ